MLVLHPILQQEYILSIEQKYLVVLTSNGRLLVHYEIIELIYFTPLLHERDNIDMSQDLKSLMVQKPLYKNLSNEYDLRHIHEHILRLRMEFILLASEIMHTIHDL